MLLRDQWNYQQIVITDEESQSMKKIFTPKDKIF